MKAIYKVIFVMCFSVVMSGCATVAQGVLESGLVKKPTINVAGVALRQVSLQNIGIDLQLDVSNPNAFGFNIKGIDYRVKVNGYDLLAGQQQGLAVQANANNSITVPLNFTFSQLSQLLSSMRQLSNLGYELETKTYVDLPRLGVISIPSTHKGAWNLSQLLRFKF